MADEEAVAPSIQDEEKKVVRVGGRRRAASINTRLFGHFINEKKPRAVTWCIGVMTLKSDPGGNIIRDYVFNKLTEFPRFRSSLKVGRFGGGFVELSPERMIELRDSYFWTEIYPDGNATIADINKTVGETETWKFDKTLPLWRLQYCRKMASGEAVVIATVNHAIGDGVSLIECMLRLCDEGIETIPVTVDRRKTKQAPNAPKKLRGPRLRTTQKIGSFMHGINQGLFQSLRAADEHNALRMPDHTHPSPIKLIAQCPDIDLAELKKIKNKFPGATLNDIIMAVLTMTMKAFFVEVGATDVLSGQKKVRGAFPVNIRKKKKGSSLKNGDPYNAFAFGIFKFDFQYKSRIDIVWKTKKQIDLIKASPSPLIQSFTLKPLARILPRKVLMDTILHVSNTASCQLSNVVGPQTKQTMCGVDLERVAFFLISPNHVYVGIISYNGKVSVTINIDSSTGIDPQQLSKHWVSEYQALKDELAEIKEEYVKAPRF